MPRLVVVLLLLLALPVRANLGDTVADCVKRYGKPGAFTEANAKVPFGTMVFAAGPYQLIVFLNDTVEVGARVSKKDKTAFTPDEMKTIMDADAPTPWVSTPSADPTCLTWSRDDKATVLYDQNAKMLIFTSPQMAAILQAKAPPLSAAITTPAPPHPNVTIAPPIATPWNLISTNAAPTNAPSSAPLPQ